MTATLYERRAFIRGRVSACLAAAGYIPARWTPSTEDPAERRAYRRGRREAFARIAGLRGRGFWGRLFKSVAP